MSACCVCSQMGHSECVTTMPKARAHPPSRTVEDVVGRLRGEEDSYPIEAADDTWNAAIDRAIAIVRESLIEGDGK